VHRTALGLAVDFAELTDPGRDPTKQLNEDSSGFAETPVGLLAVICDGMGGHAGGQQASETAVRVIRERCCSAAPSDDPAETLRYAIEAAGQEVYALGGTSPESARPGSTCVAVLMARAGAVIAHVGDSRLMLVRGGHLTRLTRDHSMVQQMVDAGMLTEAEAAQHPDANQITRALGMEPRTQVELQPSPLELVPGDVLLLTSDGVTDLVADPELLEVVRERLSRSPAAVCDRVVQLANARGGHDNLTIQIVHVLDSPGRARVGPAAPTVRGETLLLDAERDAGVGGPRTARILDRAGASGFGTVPVLPARPHLHPTVVDPSHGGADTVVDGSPMAGGAVVRRTQPDLALTERREPPAHRPETSPQPVASRLSPTARRRAWLTAAALVVFVALGIALAWWGRRSRASHANPEPPLPSAPPPAPPVPSPAPAAPTELVPEVPPELPGPVPTPPGMPTAAVTPTDPAGSTSSRFP